MSDTTGTDLGRLFDRWNSGEALSLDEVADLYGIDAQTMRGRIMAVLGDPPRLHDDDRTG